MLQLLQLDDTRKILFGLIRMIGPLGVIEGPAQVAVAVVQGQRVAPALLDDGRIALCGGKSISTMRYGPDHLSGNAVEAALVQVGVKGVRVKGLGPRICILCDKIQQCSLQIHQREVGKFQVRDFLEPPLGQPGMVKQGEHQYGLEWR